MRNAAAVSLVVALLLAGCLDNQEVDSVEEAEPPVVIAGYVLDPLLVPVPGVIVQLGGIGLQNTTGGDGRFEFIVANASVVTGLRATGAGFYDAEMNLDTDPGNWTDLRIRMERIVKEVPYHSIVSYNGFLACSALVMVGHNHGGTAHEDNQVDCSAGDTSDHVWEFPVANDLENGVIEVRWEANSVAAEYLVMTIDAVGAGRDGEDERLFFVEGTSPLRGNIAIAHAATYFDQGGTVRVEVDVAGPESDVVTALAVNQEFEALAALFYVEPGASNHSFD